jgi:hypothetical protein
MEALIQALEKIIQIPGAMVDKEEDAAIYAQILSLFEQEEKLDLYISENLNGIQQLVNWVKPFKLSKDFLLFQYLYAGISIDTKEYNLTLNGLGPHFEQYYPSIMGDQAWTKPKTDGLLALGDLQLLVRYINNEYYYAFLLDLNKVFAQEYNVIAIGPMDGSYNILFEAIKNPAKYQDKWVIVGNSFTEWICAIAEAEGKLSWLPLDNKR